MKVIYSPNCHIFSRGQKRRLWRRIWQYGRLTCTTGLCQTTRLLLRSQRTLLMFQEGLAGRPWWDRYWGRVLKALFIIQIPVQLEHNTFQSSITKYCITPNPTFSEKKCSIHLEKLPKHYLILNCLDKQSHSWPKITAFVEVMLLFWATDQQCLHFFFFFC